AAQVERLRRLIRLNWGAVGGAGAAPGTFPFLGPTGGPLAPSGRRTMMSTEWHATRERPVLSARLRRWALGLLALGLTGTLAGTGLTQRPAPRAPVQATGRGDKP